MKKYLSIIAIVAAICTQQALAVVNTNILRNVYPETDGQWELGSSTPYLGVARNWAGLSVQTIRISTTTAGCLQVSAVSVFSTGTACGAGGGSSSSGPTNTLQASNGSGGFVGTGTPALSAGYVIATTSVPSTFSSLNISSSTGVVIGSSNISSSTAGTQLLSVGTANKIGGPNDNIAVGNSNQVYCSFLSSVGDCYAFGSSNILGANAYLSGAYGYSNTISPTSAVGNQYAFGSLNTITAGSGFVVGSGITNNVTGSLMIGPSNTSKVTILPTGQVGIGTTSPYATLSVVGQVVGAYLTATTTATSTLPRESSTGISTTWLCLTGDTCRTTWPSGGGGGGSPNSKWATSSDTTSIYTASATKIGVGTSTPDAQGDFYNLLSTPLALFTIAVTDDGAVGSDYTAGDLITYHVYSVSTVSGATYYSTTYNTYGPYTIVNSGDGLLLELGSGDGSAHIERDVNGGGYTTYADVASGSFIDYSYSPWTSPAVHTPTEVKQITKINYSLSSILYGLYTNSKIYTSDNAQVDGALRIGSNAPNDTSAPFSVVNNSSNGEARLGFFEAKQNTERVEFTLTNSGDGGSWTNNFLSIMNHGSAYPNNYYSSHDAGSSIFLGQGANFYQMGFDTYGAGKDIFFSTNNSERLRLSDTGFNIKAPVLLNGAAGTAGQVLTSGGAGVASSWSTVSSGSGTVSAGGVGQIAYYNAAGTTVVGTSTQKAYFGSYVATTTIASILPYASTTMIDAVTASTSIFIASGKVNMGTSGAKVMIGSINTATPGSALTVNGEVTIGNSIVTTQAPTNGLLVQGTVGFGTTSPSAKLSITGNGTGTGRTFALSNSSNIEKITILDNGNFGISTTSPYTRLSIEGDAAIGGPVGVIAKAFYATSTAVTVADTTIVSTAASSTIFTVASWPNRVYKANTLRVGSQICFSASGTYNTTGITPSATPRILLGTGSATTTLGQVTTSGLASGATGLAFDANGCVTVRSIGASGSVLANAVLDYATAVGTNKRDVIRGAATTIDTTVDQVFDLTVQFDTSSASEGATITQAASWLR